jgi:hypothetical protein
MHQTPDHRAARSGTSKTSGRSAVARRAAGPTDPCTVLAAPSPSAASLAELRACQLRVDLIEVLAHRLSASSHIRLIAQIGDPPRQHLSVIRLTKLEWAALYEHSLPMRLNTRRLRTFSVVRYLADAPQMGYSR